MELWLTRRLGLYYGPCLNLLRNQGPDPRPLWLLVGIWTWARVQTARSTAYFNWCPYIFLIYMYYYITIYVCVPHFYDLSALVGCWSSVSIRRIIYKFLNVCPFDYTAVAVSGKVERSEAGLTTPVEWQLLLQLTVLSRSAIVVLSKFWWRFLCCHVDFLDFSVGVGAFVTGLSQISSFFSYPNPNPKP